MLRLSAFAQLSNDLTAELERVAIGGVTRKMVRDLRDRNENLQNEIDRTHTQTSETVARHEQKIEELNSSIATLEAKNSALIKAVELLERTLEKSTQSITDLHQSNVELCMQGLDYKAEVNHRLYKMLASIEGVLGYLPESIQTHSKQIQLLAVGHPPQYLVSA